MAKRNVTLAVEEEVLQGARLVAARRQTSLDTLLREYLEQLVGRERERLATWDRGKRLVEQPVGRIGGALPTRAELHDR